MKHIPKYSSVSEIQAKNNWFPVPDFGKTPDSQGDIMQNNAKRLSTYALPLQPDRRKQDIASWRAAVKEAEAPYYPYRVKMQTMFYDTILNDHVQASLAKRKNLSLLKEFMICGDNGAEDKEATKLIKKKWFFNLMNNILDAQFFGYSFITLGDFEGNAFPNATIIKRDLIVPDYQVNNAKNPYYAQIPYMPDGLHFMDRDNKDEDGISYYDWTLWITTPSDIGQSSVGYGLLYYVAKNEILLRNNQGWNADYIEVYGSPMAVAKSDAKEADSVNGGGGERARLETALANRGSNSYLIIGKDDEVEFVKGEGAGRGNEVFDNFEERLQKGISKILLGHADALESTPGKLGQQGGEKDGQPTDAVSKALRDAESIDCSFIEDWMNSLVIPKLINIGLPIPLGKQFKFKNDNERNEIQAAKNDNSLSVATIAKTMKEAGLKMDAAHFEKETGIPTTEVEEDSEEAFETAPAKQFGKEIKNALELSFKH